MLREFFKEHDVVRYAFVMETWMSPRESPLRPSEHSDRVESVIIGIQDETAGAMLPLTGMSYGQALRWAGPDRHRLHLVAQARGYKPGLVWHRLQEIAES
jgi:hypothetical protein